jgi:hypothetical protein
MEVAALKRGPTAVTHSCGIVDWSPGVAQMSDTEKMHLERYFDWQGDSVRLESLHGRRKSKKTYEYEVKWYGKRENKNSWITREQ